MRLPINKRYIFFVLLIFGCDSGPREIAVPLKLHSNSISLEVLSISPKVIQFTFEYDNKQSGNSSGFQLCLLNETQPDACEPIKKLNANTKKFEIPVRPNMLDKAKNTYFVMSSIDKSNNVTIDPHSILQAVITLKSNTPSYKETLGIDIVFSKNGNYLFATTIRQVLIFEKSQIGWNVIQTLSFAGADKQLSVSDDALRLVVGIRDEWVEDTYGDQIREAGRIYILDAIDGEWQNGAETIAIESPSPSEFGYFGYSVSLSGNGQHLAVGEPSKSNSFRGRVTTYFKNQAGWHELPPLEAPAPSSHTFYGKSVALNQNGMILIVGRPMFLGEAGEAFVYELTANGWEEKFQLSPSGTTRTANFGSKVAVNAAGSKFAASAPNVMTMLRHTHGEIYFFDHDGQLIHILEGLEARYPKSAPPLFGADFALSDDWTTLIVGAPHNRTGITGIVLPSLVNDSLSSEIVRSGSAYLYELDQDNIWQLILQLKAPYVADPHDQYGKSVTINGNGDTIAISSPYDDSSSTTRSDNKVRDSGVIYVY